jgi:superfamily I DNA and/or RNA helicase
MGQKVYSDEAKELHFDLSIVERLCIHYKAVSRLSADDKFSLPRLLLRNNYRNHPEVLQFISSTFYYGKLVSKSNEQADEKIPRLNFYAAYGRETQREDGTSWYNWAEVQEVVERVNELYNSWPESWGVRDAKAILVTTAYSDQVMNSANRWSVSLMNRH